jgi:hypothetical protein
MKHKKVILGTAHYYYPLLLIVLLVVVTVNHIKESQIKTYWALHTYFGKLTQKHKKFFVGNNTPCTINNTPCTINMLFQVYNSEYPA